MTQAKKNPRRRPGGGGRRPRGGRRTEELLAANAELRRQIEERRGAEAALRQAEGRYRALADNSPAGIFHTDAEGKTLYVNKAWCDLTGLTAEEGMGDGWRRAIHPGDRDAKLHEWSQAVASESAIRGKPYRILRPDGSVAWVVGYAVPLYGEDGKISGYVGSIHDITSYVQAQEVIRESEENYRALFEQSRDAIYVCAPDGDLLEINRAGLELLGYEERETLLATSLHELYADDHERESLMRELFKHGFVKDREVRLKRRDGATTTALVTANEVLDRSGVVQAYRTILRDVTDQKELERQLQQAQKMEAIGRLAGGVAHDFNNLLTAIIGYSDLLTMSLPADDPRRRSIDEIKAAARRGSDLTSQLLAFGRCHVVSPQPISLNRVVRQMRNLLRRLIGEQVELVTDLEPGTAAIRADPTQIEQVIVNLAINARDAMPDGGTLTLATRTVEFEEGERHRAPAVAAGTYVRLLVSDTGTGIDEAIQDRIFEPFFTTKSSAKGNGLGLATVYGAVQQAGGQLVLRSAPDEGTDFEIYFPHCADEVAPEEEEPPEERVAGGGSETVLLVEDEPAVRSFLEEMLLHHGYEVLTAEDGEAALEVAREYDHTIHLLLSDVVMPRMNGIELARALKELRPQVKILLVSGYTDNQPALREPGTAFLQKPFQPEVLTRRLRQILGDGPKAGPSTH